MEGIMTKPVKKAAPKPTRATASATPARSAAKPRVAAATRPRAAATNPGTTTGRASRSTPAVGFDLSHDVIAARAFDLYERSGHPHGRDVEFWLEAERQMKSRLKT
jgi:hypothetical protein